MKFLKGLLITLLALIVVYVLLALFSPSTYSVTRELEMDASEQAVWNQINTFEKWQAWSSWAEKDPTLKSSYEGAPGELGAKSSWTGDPELSGTGSMTINESIANEKIGYDLVLPEWDSKSVGYIKLTKKEGDKTNVTWNDYGDVPFIMRPMGLFGLFDKMMGPDFEKGLENIKKIAEESANSPKPIEISETDLPAVTYLGIRHKTTISEVTQQQFFATNYGKLMVALSMNKITPLGSPVALYYSWNEEDSTAEVVPAIPVGDLGDMDLEGMEVIKVEAGSAVKAAYYGPYEGGAAAHYKLGEYCEKNSIKTGLVMEEYANDPTTVSSPDEYLTNVYYYKVQ